MTNFSLIITAGGSSSRYGKENKLLEKINGKTVIEHTVSKFLYFEEIHEIIIPTHKNIIDKFSEILTDSRIKIIEGGENRQQSVYKALQYVKNDYVVIHDGARPVINKDTVKEVLQTVVDKNAVSVMTKTTDTIKEVDENGKIVRTIDRSKLYNTQTPQAFRTDIIKSAHEKFKNESFTDDALLLETLNIPVYIVKGSYTNIKITTKSDLDFAKLYI